MRVDMSSGNTWLRWGIRRALSVLLLASLLTPSLPSLRASWEFDRGHRCSCSNGTTKCCKHSRRTADPLITSRGCPADCDCSGALAGASGVLFTLEALQNWGDWFQAAMAPAESTPRVGGASPNPLHQRPPPPLSGLVPIGPGLRER